MVIGPASRRSGAGTPRRGAGAAPRRGPPYTGPAPWSTRRATAEPTTRPAGTTPHTRVATCRRPPASSKTPPRGTCAGKSVSTYSLTREHSPTDAAGPVYQRKSTTNSIWYSERPLRRHLPLGAVRQVYAGQSLACSDSRLHQHAGVCLRMFSV